MSLSTEQLKKLFADEVKKYSTDKNSFKEYYLSMKDLNDWLKGKEK